MIIKFQGIEYEATYSSETNTVGVKNPDNKILNVINDNRIQRGLLIGYLLNNQYYNLDEAIKNPLL